MKAKRNPATEELKTMLEAKMIEKDVIESLYEIAEKIQDEIEKYPPGKKFSVTFKDADIIDIQRELIRLTKEALKAQSMTWELFRGAFEFIPDPVQVDQVNNQDMKIYEDMEIKKLGKDESNNL